VTRVYRAAVLLLFALMALAVMQYLSGRFARRDVVQGVEAVQAHLYGDGGEATFRQRLAAGFHLQDPELQWWGRVVSDFYGIVQVTLVAREGEREVTCVWKIALLSGDLSPENPEAVALLRFLAAGNRG
jgi:hypothetical protein